MTIQELYDYAKKHNALEYHLCGTSLSCGPHFDVVKVLNESKTVYVEDTKWGAGVENAKNNGFDYIGFNWKL